MAFSFAPFASFACMVEDMLALFSRFGDVRPEMLRRPFGLDIASWGSQQSLETPQRSSKTSDPVANTSLVCLFFAYRAANLLGITIIATMCNLVASEDR